MTSRALGRARGPALPVSARGALATIARATPTWAWVLLGYLALAVVTTWPLALDFGGHIYGHAGGDGIGGIAYFSAWQQSLLQGHFGSDPLLAYPAGVNLRASLVPPFYFIVEFPLTLVFGATQAYNLLAFTCFPLSAIAGYGLCRVLRISAPAAAAGGVFYGYTTYHAVHAAGHTTLPHTEFFALVLALLLMWRQSGRLRWALLAALSLAATLTWDYYFAVFVMLMLGAAGIAWLVSDTVLRGPRRALLRGLVLAAVVLLALALALPQFALAKSQVPAVALANRNVGEVLIFSAQPCQLLLPGPTNPQFGGLACPPHLGLPPAEVGLYVGWIALALGLWFLASSAWRGLPTGVSSSLWVVVPIGVVGLAWAMPAVWQQLVHTSPPTILWSYVAGLRVSARSVVLTQLAVAVMGAAGLQRLLPRVAPAWRHGPLSAVPTPRSRSTRPGAWLLSGGAAALFFMESIGVGAPASPLPHPPVNEWLASLPRGTVVMQYPSAWPGTPTEGTGYFYAYYHYRYQLPDVGTLIGPVNTGSDVAAELWITDANTAGELAAAGVKYAVSHTGEAYDIHHGRDVLHGLPGFRPVYSSQGDTVYEVTASPVPFAYLTGDFFEAETRSPTVYARWMHASGRLVLVNPSSVPVNAILHLDMWCLGDCRDQVILRGDGLGRHMSQVLGPESIPVTLPPGTSSIEVIPPNPPRPIGATEDRKVTLYVFRPLVTLAPPAPAAGGARRSPTGRQQPGQGQ